MCPIIYLYDHFAYPFYYKKSVASNMTVEYSSGIGKQFKCFMLKGDWNLMKSCRS